MFNLLGANRRDIALSPAFDNLRDYIVSETGDSSTFVGWPTSPNPFPIPRLGTNDHFTAVWCRGGNVDAFLQFFGEIPFVFRLGSLANNEEFCFSYLVNPHRDTSPVERRNQDFDPSVIPAFDSCPHLPGPDVWKSHSVRIGRFFLNFRNARKTEL